MSLRWKPFYGWWVLLSAATVLMAGFAMAAYALPVFYPELVNAFRWPRASVALGGSLKTLLVGLVAPLNGWIIDRKGVKIILLPGMVTLGVSVALLSGIDSLWQFYVLCFFMGVGGSWVHHLPAQLLVANWFVKRRGLAMGLLTAFSGFGDLLLPVLSALLIRNLGWRDAFLTLPIILIVPFLAVTFVVRNQPQDMGLYPDGALEPAAADPRPPGHRRHTSTGPGGGLSASKAATFWMLAGMLFLSAWAQFSLWQHFPLFLRDEGFSLLVAASLFGFLFLGASIFGRFLGGYWCDKISADYAFCISLAFMGSAVALLFATHSSAIIYLCLVLFGLGYGGTIAIRPLLVFEHFGATGVGKLYGVATAMFTSGAFVGPVLAGHIHDRTGSYHLAFLLALLLIGISMVLVMLLKRANPLKAT